MRSLALILIVFGSSCLARDLENLNEEHGRESRITRGSEATEGQFPYHAILRVNNSSLCGGSIVGDKWILTAAHCLVSDNPDDFTVTVGTISLTSGTNYSVDKIIPHSSFNMTNPKKYDVALVKLKNKIEFSENVKKISLEWRPIGKVDCVVTGFGSTRSIFQKPSQTLRYLNTTVLGWLKCYFSGGGITKLCTRGPFLSSTCIGDDGGPLVANGRQIGIVSFGSRFCSGLIPTVYSKVSYYLYWIKTTMLFKD